MNISLFDSGSSIVGASSYLTNSKSYVAGRLYYFSVATRTAITADPNQPTATLTGLTILAITNPTTVYDNSSSSRRRLTTFLCLCTSNTTGQVTFAFGGQAQTTFLFATLQITGHNTTTPEAQSKVNQDVSGTATSLLLTLNSVPTNGLVIGSFANGDGTGTRTLGTGFTSIADLADANSDIRLSVEYQMANDQTIDMSWSTNAECGVVGIEIQAAIKKIEGVGIASVKKIIGIVLGSAKKISGITNG